MNDAPLTTSEATELERCEATIARGYQTFIDVGNALAEIRDRKLYRATHATFADYCTDRWKMSRQRAYQLIDASETAANLSTTVDIPADVSERVLRPLAALPPAEQPDAWQAAKARSGGTPTARDVAAVVRERQTPEPAPAPADLARAGFAWLDAAQPTILHAPSGWRCDAPTAELALELARDRLATLQRPAPPRPAAPISGWWNVGLELNAVQAAIDGCDQVAAVRAALRLAAALAGERIELLAAALDDHEYEALAVYARALIAARS